MTIQGYNPQNLYASPSLGGVFLRRLRRLLLIRRNQWEELATEGHRLIDRAIYTTYCDAIGLVEEEVGEEARKLLHDPNFTRRRSTTGG